MSWRASAWVKNLASDVSSGFKLTSTHKCLLYTLADYFNDESGNAYPSVERLAKESWVSTRQAIRLIGDLERAQIIKVTRRANQPSLYSFITHKTAIARTDTDVSDKLSVGDTAPQLSLTPAAFVSDIAMSDKQKSNNKKSKRDDALKNASRIYLAYPVHKGKTHALPAIERAIMRVQLGESDRGKMSEEQAVEYLLEATEAFDRERAALDPKFEHTKWPQGWFNDHSYLDARYHAKSHYGTKTTLSPSEKMRAQLGGA